MSGPPRPVKPPAKPTPFETFVRRVAAVPKSEIDALAKAEREKPRIKRGPKPKPRT
jgi:hypothetical protein